MDETFSSLLTICLGIVGANAVNLIDGLDGLAAGVVAAGGCGLLIYAVTSINQSGGGLGGSVVILGAAIVGVCAGFYVHNCYPAKIFMSDAGALLLGTLLVASAILSVQLFPAIGPAAQGVALGSVSRVAVFLWLALPLAVIGIPLLDLTIAVVRRIKKRQPMFAPDKKHLHHILVETGRSQRAASAQAQWMLR